MAYVFADTDTSVGHSSFVSLPWLWFSQRSETRSNRDVLLAFVLACRVWVSAWALEKRVSSNTDSRSLQRKSRLLIKATFDPWNEALLHQTPTPECSFKDYFRLTWHICPNPQKDNQVIQGDDAADDVSRLQMPWFVARLNWQTGDLRRLVAAVHSNRKRKNPPKKSVRLSQIPAAALQKVTTDRF